MKNYHQQGALTATEIIYRSAAISKNDVLPILKYLKLAPSTLDDSKKSAEEIVGELREAGSNSVATMIRGNGVSYEEIVYDVGQKLKAKVEEDFTRGMVEQNENAILAKLFEGALERLNDDERRMLLQSMNIREFDFPIGSIAAIMAQISAGAMSYQLSMAVAQMISTALLKTSLSFASNVALTRSASIFLGPIGWLASGLWLALDLAGPAFRKTVPCVVHIAMLRKMLNERVNIGVVGDTSSGKDAMISAVFGLDSDIDPVAGSTTKAQSYQIDKAGTTHVINYPGFKDYRSGVNSHVDDYLSHTDIFVLVVDIIRGVSSSDRDALDKLQQYSKENPVLICLNKIDLIRTEQEKNKLLKAVKQWLLTSWAAENYHLIETSFDPDPRLNIPKIGCEKVRKWLHNELVKQGKSATALE